MIQAITFDLWNTLIREAPEAGQRIKEARIRGLYMFLQGQGYPGSLEEVEAAYEQVGEHLQGIWARNIDAGSEEQVQILLKALNDGWRLSQDQMALANLEWAYVSPALQALPVLTQGAFFERTVASGKPEVSDMFRGQILGALGKVDHPRVADVVLEHYPKMGAELQPKADDAPSPVTAAIGALMRSGGMILHGEQEFEIFRDMPAELIGDTPKVAFDHYGREWGQHYQEPLWAAIGVCQTTERSNADSAIKSSRRRTGKGTTRSRSRRRKPVR